LIESRLNADEISLNPFARGEGEAKPASKIEGSGLLTKALIENQWRDIVSSYSSLVAERNRSESAYSASKAMLTKYEKQLPLITARSNKIAELLDKGYSSEVEYLIVEQEKIEIAQNLASEREHLREISAQIQGAKEALARYGAHLNTQLISQVRDNRTNIETLQEELIKADTIDASKVIYAPIDGQVQDLAVTALGGVVTDAQPLMKIVPSDDTLEAEVLLENKDIGFVKEGMPVDIKIHTFPFTKYGTIDGIVEHVDDDADLNEKTGLMYGMRISMNTDELLVDQRIVKLQPGMSVTAKVTTGRRKIIEFFFAPLIQAQRESLRER